MILHYFNSTISLSNLTLLSAIIKSKTLLILLAVFLEVDLNPKFLETSFGRDFADSDCL